MTSNDTPTETEGIVTVIPGSCSCGSDMHACSSHPALAVERAVKIGGKTPAADAILTSRDQFVG